MESFYSEFWWAYLTYQTIQKCVAISKQNCPGCSKSIKAALLHKHHQDSLLEKIVLYLNEARGLMSSNFDSMFEDFKDLMDYKFCDDERKVLIKTGRTFLFVITPPSLFYGRYLTEEKYSQLFRASTATYTPKSPTIPPTQKRKRHTKPTQPTVPNTELSKSPTYIPEHLSKKRKISKPSPAPQNSWVSKNLVEPYDSDIC